MVALKFVGFQLRYVKKYCKASISSSTKCWQNMFLIHRYRISHHLGLNIIPPCIFGPHVPPSPEFHHTRIPSIVIALWCLGEKMWEGWFHREVHRISGHMFLFCSCKVLFRKYWSNGFQRSNESYSNTHVCSGSYGIVSMWLFLFCLLRSYCYRALLTWTSLSFSNL